jgi:hypothetical protein
MGNSILSLWFSLRIYHEVLTLLRFLNPEEEEALDEEETKKFPINLDWEYNSGIRIR